jgi:hypothetical protein
METKGENLLYSWELINNAWKVLPQYRKNIGIVRPLGKLDKDGLVPTEAGRIGKSESHYKD